MTNLSDFFKNNSKVALGFSGGVDSAYLLYAALAYGAQVRAYYVKSAFQPQFELDDAKRLATQLKADLVILPVDVLADSTITNNPVNRCYYCKSLIFSVIAKAARNDGYNILMDGTNASDDVADRPGMQALKELSVRSPLRECGMTKSDIRALSREAGLFTWNKPSYACLATRIPFGQSITAEKLNHTELSEAFLMSLGFRDFRIRMNENSAKLQVSDEEMEKVFKYRFQIIKELHRYYDSVTLDLEGRNE